MQKAHTVHPYDGDKLEYSSEKARKSASIRVEDVEEIEAPLEESNTPGITFIILRLKNQVTYVHIRHIRHTGKRVTLLSWLLRYSTSSLLCCSYLC